MFHNLFSSPVIFRYLSSFSLSSLKLCVLLKEEIFLFTKTRFGFLARIGWFVFIPYTDLKIKINKYIQQQRQHRWSNNKYNKLLEIKPISREWKQSFRKSQKKEVILSRLHWGHRGVTHSYLLKEEQQPNVPSMPDNIHNKTCSHWMHWWEIIYNVSCVREVLKKKKLKRTL